MEINALEDRWEGIIGLMGKRFPEFLRVLTACNRLVRSIRDLFKVIRRSYRDRSAAIEMIRGMEWRNTENNGLAQSGGGLWTAEERDS